MKNVLTYTGKDLQTGALVAEHQELYVEHLNKAINKFNASLEYIDRRSQDPMANPDELLIVTTKAIMEMSDACETFEQQAFDKSVLKQAQVSFREKTHELISRSYFMNRARTWPQGYAGDFETLEGIYRDLPKSDGVGYYLDRYFLATTLPAAVRARKETLLGLLKDELGRRRDPRVLDVACGSCREVLELAPEIKESGARFTCIDFDADALDFAANRLAFAGMPTEQTIFRKYNALKMIKHDRNVKEFGMQDVIYSVGFFDYLPDDTLIALLGALYALLSPGGTLITSFKDCRRYRAQEYHWFVDWDGFLQRTEEDSREVLMRAGIPPQSVTAVRDSTEVILFLSATK